MKKLISIFLLLLLLTSCGSNNNVENVVSNDVDVEVKKDQTEITTDAGDEIVITSDLDKSVEIPDGYPENILPVYKDSKIIAASKNQDNSFLIMGYTKDEFLKVKDFYKETLKDATILMEDAQVDSYINMGEIGGISYTVSINPSMEELEYNVSFSLIVMPIIGYEEPEESADTDTSSDSTSSNNTSESSGDVTGFTVPEGVNWPESYPEEIIPAYNKGNAQAAIVVKQSDKMLVGLMTEDEVDVVVEYYKKYLSEADDFSQIATGNPTILIGTLNGVNISITIGANGPFSNEDMRFKTLIQIVY